MSGFVLGRVLRYTHNSCFARSVGIVGVRYYKTNKGRVQTATALASIGIIEQTMHGRDMVLLLPAYIQWIVIMSFITIPVLQS